MALQNYGQLYGGVLAFRQLKYWYVNRPQTSFNQPLRTAFSSCVVRMFLPARSIDCAFLVSLFNLVRESPQSSFPTTTTSNGLTEEQF